MFLAVGQKLTIAPERVKAGRLVEAEVSIAADIRGNV